VALMLTRENTVNYDRALITSEYDSVALSMGVPNVNRA